MINVDHNNFEEALNKVKSGTHAMAICTYTHTIIIDKKIVTKFEKAGLNVIAKDSDGKGFRLQQGKRRNYVHSGYLVLSD